LHTDDLPDKERTSDKKIKEVSVEQNRIIISKDSDFLDSLLISGVPSKLLLVTTGNIINKELLILFEKYFDSIVQLFDLYNLIELDNEQIVVHEK
jgi:predicted nuclease of predicted toxin-antitoxin system